MSASTKKRANWKYCKYEDGIIRIFFPPQAALFFSATEKKWVKIPDPYCLPYKFQG